MIADSISPRLAPNIEIVTVENTSLLIVDVVLSGRRLHYVSALGLDEGTYVRLGRATAKLTHR